MFYGGNNTYCFIGVASFSNSYFFRFTSTPNNYPEEAWNHYDDTTCEYNCMVTEYMYWALTSLLGAQENRANEINNEWELNTPELLEESDLLIFNLLTNPQYNFPAVLPDGTYMR